MKEWQTFTGVSGVGTVGTGNITYTTFTTKDKYYMKKYYFEKNGKYYAVSGLVSEELDNLVSSIK